jgi:hypothetical protein
VKLPKGDDVDVRGLAKEYDLTGAEILRCVRLAASIATSDERKIDMQLLKAAAAERVSMREGSLR